MKSLTAIVLGSLFIFVATLLLQLAALIVVVAYNALAKDYAFLNDMGAVFRYLIGMPAYLLVMLAGGYITAYIARVKVLQHCLVVGVLAAGASMWFAIEGAELTITGMVMTVLMIAATLIGGKLWQRGAPN